LQSIQAENDVSVRLFLLEKFVSQFPKFESLDAVYANMQSLYMYSGDLDNTIAAGTLSTIVLVKSIMNASYKGFQFTVEKKMAVISG
jgi:hypothetical protein